MEKNEREKDAENQTELGAKLGAKIPGSVWRHTKIGESCAYVLPSCFAARRMA